MTRRIIALHMAILLSTGHFLGCSANADEPMKKPIFKVSDFPTKVIIEGSLGKPLGTVCDVVGRWHNPPPTESKQHALRFIIKDINGVVIEDEILFDKELIESATNQVSMPRPRNGDTWRLRGFETGGIVGFPREVWKELGETVQERYGYRFLTKIICLSAKREPSTSSNLPRAEKETETKEDHFFTAPDFSSRGTRE